MAMRGYDRDELDYYDEYEEEGNEYEDEAEEEEEGEEEEYETEEPPKPTKEELEYLELRQRLKESIRKRMKKDNGVSASKSIDKKNKLPYDNYGSFFGPSQPVIAQRVIQESKTLLENPHLVSRVSNPQNVYKAKTTSGGSQSSSMNRLPRVKNEVKTKVQKLKDTRDYSFLLSDDAELPVPTKEPPPRNVSVPSSEARPAQVPGKVKQPLSTGGKYVNGGQGDRKQVSVSGQLHFKAGINNKLPSASKHNLTSTDSRKHLGSTNGGPGRPIFQKGVPLKKPTSAIVSKSPAPGLRTTINGVKRPLPPKSTSSLPKQRLEQKKQLRDPDMPKGTPKQPVASAKLQANNQLKRNLSNPTLHDQRPKKKPLRRFSDDEDDDGGKAISMIRQMFGYNPRKFVNDDDDSDMEANFDDIMAEERRSAKIARKEDEEQLRLIEEEEARERKRKMEKLKKRKLGL